jgi:hypothetical protein
VENGAVVVVLGAVVVVLGAVVVVLRIVDNNVLLNVYKGMLPEITTRITISTTQTDMIMILFL